MPYDRDLDEATQTVRDLVADMELQDDLGYYHVTPVTIHGHDETGLYPYGTFQMTGPDGQIWTAEIRRGSV